ncbi:hypothetical protein FYJ34_00765 [Clostridiaceae bacterium 68-1-5]|uniref:YjeF N-terminal domain-containing protein n=1 Tax=Suipraeoptans intestinalis TaxID=2606628 RepID=A0A6N7UXF9_9FIRM|nr:NAD(P)H-hydrate epimerase [Suipraeoptans intestinalis]MSR92839.1 hypothetical protein [Suipraeoptans intestinalis]
MLLHVLFYEGGEEPVRMLLTKEQMKQADAYTISQKGIPAETLMERAAFAFVEALLKRKTDLPRVCVLCGTGNNGGDGLAIARILKERNVDVTVVVTGDQKKAVRFFSGRCSAYWRGDAGWRKNTGRRTAICWWTLCLAWVFPGNCRPGIRS